MDTRSMVMLLITGVVTVLCIVTLIYSSSNKNEYL